MKRSKYLAGACSAVLLAAWANPGFGNEADAQQTQKQQAQGRQSSAAAHGSQAVIDSAGQPTNVLVVGKVSDARDVTLASTAGDKHKLLKVQPNRGKEVVVDIGVRSAQNGMQFSKGDRIVAMGKPARINGQPVLFAADVAELQRVNVGSAGASSDQNNRNNSKQSSSQDSSMTSATQSDRNDDGYATVVHLFDTDNFAEDEHGLYDVDFVWTTSDPMYETWNDTATAWADTERAHYDMFGYDDAGEAGWWDW